MENIDKSTLKVFGSDDTAISYGVWYYSENKGDFKKLGELGFRVGEKICIGCVLNGCVARAEKAGFKVDWAIPKHLRKKKSEQERKNKE